MERITDPNVLRQAAIDRHQYRFYYSGRLVVPCVPSLLEEYVEQFHQVFISLGKKFAPPELEQLKNILNNSLQEGYAASTHASLVLEYQPESASGALNYQVSTVIGSVAGQYQGWIQEREPPLFRPFPDAKAINMAAKLGDPAQISILEIGPGMGRNTLPLGRLGYQVEALEVTGEFVQHIQQEADKEGLRIKARQGDFLDPLVRFPLKSYDMVFASEVIPHLHNQDQLRLMMAKVADYLRPGGLFLFNTLLPVGDYVPDQTVRELSVVHCCSLFTQSEILTSLEALPLQYIMAESQLEYEKAHQPPEAWLPENLGWFGLWSQGGGLFSLPAGQKGPIELSWIICQRT